MNDVQLEKIAINTFDSPRKINPPRPDATRTCCIANRLKATIYSRDAADIRKKQNKNGIINKSSWLRQIVSTTKRIVKLTRLTRLLCFDTKIYITNISSKSFATASLKNLKLQYKSVGKNTIPKTTNDLDNFEISNL